MKLALETKTLFVGLLVGLAHIASGLAVFIAPSAMAVTPLEAIRAVANYMGYTNGFAGSILFGVGTMAVIAATQTCSLRTRAIMFAPQQLLLVLQIIAISFALITGEYPDGYKPVGGAWFILADQVWAFLLAISHTLWLTVLLYGGGESGRPT